MAQSSAATRSTRRFCSSFADALAAVLSSLFSLRCSLFAVLSSLSLPSPVSRFPLPASGFPPHVPTRIIAPIAALAVTATCGFAQTPNAPSRASLDRVFSDWSSKDGPGCSAAASQDGRTVYEAGYGSANLEADVPIMNGCFCRLYTVSVITGRAASRSTHFSVIPLIFIDTGIFATASTTCRPRSAPPRVRQSRRRDLRPCPLACE